jgi:hypothetical protein
MTSDVARIVFKLKKARGIGPLILELARSEMGHSDRRPDDFAVAVLASAIKEGYREPVFLQADHVLVDALHYQEDPAGEIQDMKRLIKEALDAGCRQIDIHASNPG